MSKELKKAGFKEWVLFFIYLTLSGRISGLLIYFFIDKTSDQYGMVKLCVWIIVVAVAGIFWKSRYIVPGKVPTRNHDDL